VIVRDLGDAWQIVLQTDHADLSRGLADAWAERTPRHESLALAAERHDDGWAVWEQAPLVDAEGKPVNFLDVAVPAHLAFYRACIASVTDQDAYAGLLISMHGAGIYRQRYGRDPTLGLARAAEVQDEIDAFVAEQENGFAERLRATGATDDDRWRDYELLQLYDRLSLYFCMRDSARDEGELQGYRIEPRGPWQVRIDPFPFAGTEVELSLVRRVLPKRDWSDGDFRREFFAQQPERVEITIEGGET
jgi:Protein of unknown function (DUF3891)